MDRDLLDKAIESCDLGDGYMAKVRLYPHKDMIKDLIPMREVMPDELKSPTTKRAYEFMLSKLDRTQRAIYQAKKFLESDAIKIVEAIERGEK